MNLRPAVCWKYWRGGCRHGGSCPPASAIILGAFWQRAAQLFESIPSLVVTTHSGEGKAPYYLIRGYVLGTRQIRHFVHHPFSIASIGSSPTGTTAMLIATENWL